MNSSNDDYTGSVNLNPNRAETFDGRRDFLAVSTWLYKVEQYLTLAQLSNGEGPIPEDNRVLFASSFLTSNAAIWWYTLVQNNTAPATWEEFKVAIRVEFVPEDHVRRAREKLRMLHQTTSVSRYLSEFRNIVLTVPDITEAEKFDKFVNGLKYEARVEVMKSTLTTFSPAAQVALRVDSAIWGAAIGKWGQGKSEDADKGPTPMEIGNLEREKRRNSRGVKSQKGKDRKNNACFICHEPGCRPWKHSKPEVNNFEVRDDGADSDSSTDTGSEN